MKSIVISIAMVFILFHEARAQFKNELFLNDYHFYKKNQPRKATEYKDIEGSPYLSKEFIDGVLYLKDTTAVKLPLRYNIYSDEMEFKYDGINYAVGSPQSLNKVELGDAVFVYLPFAEKPGYFELLESGKAFLMGKKTVTFKPAEGPKPIEGVIPAKFVKEYDDFYILKDSRLYEITSLKSVKTAFPDKKSEIENFIKSEKIRKAGKENLINIIQYYNTL